MESLNLTRLHPPLGRTFSAEAEAVADLMLQRPVYRSDELKLDMSPAAYAKGDAATITLPDGRVVHGFASSRSHTHAYAELLYGILGADVGAPTTPYIYIADRQLVFSPAPFANARAAKDKGRHDMGGESHLQRISDATALGAIEPFTRLTNKTDDGPFNRVYAEGGQVALIDNAIPTFGSIHESVKRMVRMARGRCRFGDRRRAYHAARHEMATRIANYPDARLDKVNDYLTHALGIHVPDLVRGVRNRKQWVGSLEL